MIFVLGLIDLNLIALLLSYLVSSITNSRESTSIIIIIPPGKMLLVVISRSLCECHMKANPASPLGEFAMVPEGGVTPVLPQFGELVWRAFGPMQPVARVV